jgi:hypothetical protein
MSEWPGWAQGVLLVGIVVGLSVLSYFVMTRVLADKQWWRSQNPAIRARLASLPGGLVGIAIVLGLIFVFHLHTGRS